MKIKILKKPLKIYVYILKKKKKKIININNKVIFYYFLKIYVYI